jgi:hypothetical protein
MPRNDIPAFPGTQEHVDPGMTLRDFFAALAMTTILKGNDDYIARRSYELADAMLKERDL